MNPVPNPSATAPENTAFVKGKPAENPSPVTTTQRGNPAGSTTAPKTAHASANAPENTAAPQVRRVTEGRITSPFGRRRDPIHPNTWKEHNGIDIGAPVGTPVYAPADGVVRSTYTHSAGGMTLLMTSTDGTVRYGFCHLSGYTVKPGERVMRGQQIARSGNTGRSTGPHLHFSVKTGGRWHDQIPAAVKPTVKAHDDDDDFADDSLRLYDEPDFDMRGGMQGGLTDRAAKAAATDAKVARIASTSKGDYLGGSFIDPAPYLAW